MGAELECYYLSNYIIFPDKLFTRSITEVEEKLTTKTLRPLDPAQELYNHWVLCCHKRYPIVAKPDTAIIHVYLYIPLTLHKNQPYFQTRTLCLK
jgi:hypothetical protein